VESMPTNLPLVVPLQYEYSNVFVVWECRSTVVAALAQTMAV
jgi:hypothetical protein